MKYYVLTVRDNVANCYGAPMFVTHVGSAVREFGDACQNKPEGNALGKHPEHYELYQLGMWDDSEANFELEKPKQLAVGANYV